MVNTDRETYKIVERLNSGNENEEDAVQETEWEEETRKQDTLCGAGYFHPKWIQRFASKKAFALAYGLLGLVLYGEHSLFQGSFSAIEKNFSLSSKALGYLKSTYQVASVIGNFAAYAADRGNKLRWLSLASFLLFLGCVFSIIPVFTPISLQNINAYLTSSYGYDSTITTLNKENKCDDEKHHNLSLNLIIIPFIISSMLTGFAASIHRSCGIAYMDDNIRKNIFPIWFAGIYISQWLGYALSLIITSYALKLYVIPTYKPIITNTDPRWIGAWWLGLVLLGLIGLIMTPILLFFPKSLPRAATRKPRTKQMIEKISITDFLKTLKSILGNNILMLNTLSTTIFTLGFAATMWPKYIEIQYGVTSSKSNLIQGLIEFVARPLGILFTAFSIVKIKPRPQVLLGWNLILSSISFIVLFTLIFIGCRQQTIRGHMDETSNWILTEKCNARYNCSNNIKYSPVCDSLENQVFFSSCHAGCRTSLLNDTKTIFDHCDCVPNPEYLKEGICHTNCAASFTAYILLIGVIKISKASSRSIKTVVELRSARESDKSVSIGLARSIQTIFSTIPALIIYGYLLDASCLVWDNKCGTRGNCWLYDTNKLRYLFFITSATFIGIGMILDALIVFKVKFLKLYDEDFADIILNENEKMQNGNATEQMLPKSK